MAFGFWGIHYSERYWPEPEKFKPERYKILFQHKFLQNNLSFLPENSHAITPFTFLPFGVGPRHCIGMRLAYLEAKIGLIEALKGLRFVRDAKTEVLQWRHQVLEFIRCRPRCARTSPASQHPPTASWCAPSAAEQGKMQVSICDFTTGFLSSIQMHGIQELIKSQSFHWMEWIPPDRHTTDAGDR